MKERLILSRMQLSGELKDVYVGSSHDLLERALKEDHDDRSASDYYILQSIGDGSDGMNITKKMFRYKNGQMIVMEEYSVNGIDPRLICP